MKNVFRRGRDERGANLVEFALVLPLLLLLILGIIEFGFFLGERNEIKHAAHQGARLAAVDESNLVSDTCAAMGLGSNSTATVTFDRTGSAIGDVGTVTVVATVSSLSGLGMIDALLPPNITTEADFRLEQVATWSDGTTGSC